MKIKITSNPARLFKRPFPPPSPAKHIKALLLRRHSSVKPNAACIPEGEETEGVNLDKSFGFSKQFELITLGLLEWNKSRVTTKIPKYGKKVTKNTISDVAGFTAAYWAFDIHFVEEFVTQQLEVEYEKEFEDESEEEFEDEYEEKCEDGSENEYEDDSEDESDDESEDEFEDDTP
uniref:Calcium-dependent protein kinase n=1 Tax=Solanum tuberosum TaxID=4113 RepID=M1DVY2_SOLTU